MDASDRRPATEQRPWGSFQVLDEGTGFKVKRITVRPCGRLSLQSHARRAEHWVVVAGVAQMTIGANVRLIRANESACIAIGNRHRLENPGKADPELIEVQCGPYLGETDIVRYEDAYKRRWVRHGALD